MVYEFWLYIKKLIILLCCKILSMKNGPTKLEKWSVIFAILLISRLFGKMGCQYKNVYKIKFINERILLLWERVLKPLGPGPFNGYNKAAVLLERVEVVTEKNRNKFKEEKNSQCF